LLPQRRVLLSELGICCQFLVHAVDLISITTKTNPLRPETKKQSIPLDCAYKEGIHLAHVLTEKVEKSIQKSVFAGTYKLIMQVEVPISKCWGRAGMRGEHTLNASLQLAENGDQVDGW
jgi:hypothetical protein